MGCCIQLNCALKKRLQVCIEEKTTSFLLKKDHKFVLKKRLKVDGGHVYCSESMKLKVQARVRVYCNERKLKVQERVSVRA